MQEVKIQDLTDRCLKYFKDNCYTENRISTYKSLWRTGIIRYMNEHGIESYSLSVGADFVSTCHYQGEVRHQEREKIRSVQVLDHMLQLRHIRKVRVTPVHHTCNAQDRKDYRAASACRCWQCHHRLSSAWQTQIKAAEYLHIKQGSLCGSHQGNGMFCDQHHHL